MYKDKSVLAVIPARSGSKGIPGKNVKPLCGKPLIAWSIEAGLESKCVDEVMVTTDGREIADVAKRYGASVPFLRPQELASDTSPTFDAVKHVIDSYKAKFKRQFDYVVLLEPTSPLREADDIDGMIRRLVDVLEYDAIISIGEVSEHPSILKRIENGTLVPFCKELKTSTRRQDNEPAYFPYGVAYIAKTTALLAEQTFYCRKSLYYKIKRYQCYEIDDIYDFLAVENVMQYEWHIT